MRAFLGIAVALGLSACLGPTTSASYIDFVKANGITYVGGYTLGDRLGRALTDADLGVEQFRVKQSIADAGKGLGYQLADGDAAFLPAGAPVYSVTGYAPTFRVAARRDGRLVLYEVDTNPAAKIGQDLLDIAGKVVGIALVSEKDGTTVLGRITEPQRIRSLVKLVLDAPVDQSQSTAATSPRTALPTPTTPILQRGGAVFVAFELADATVTRRAYDVTGGVLSRGIQVTGAFRTAIAELMAAVPTPTPVPSSVNLTRRYDLARATRITIKSLQYGASADQALLPRFVSALDADLPATRARQRPFTSEPVVILEFADHFVSLVYDRDQDLLLVVVPDDEFGIAPSAELRQLLEAAR